MTTISNNLGESSQPEQHSQPSGVYGEIEGLQCSNTLPQVGVDAIFHRPLSADTLVDVEDWLKSTDNIGYSLVVVLHDPVDFLNEVVVLSNDGRVTIPGRRIFNAYLNPRSARALLLRGGDLSEWRYYLCDEGTSISDLLRRGSGHMLRRIGLGQQPLPIPRNYVISDMAIAHGTHLEAIATGISSFTDRGVGEIQRRPFRF